MTGTSRLHSVVLYGLVAVVVLLALAVTALRVAVAVAPGLQREVADMVSAQLDRPVRIQQLEARMAGFGLAFTLHGVQVGTGSAAVRVERLELGLHPWAVLLPGRSALAWVGIDGLDLTAVRDADGIELRIGRSELATLVVPGRLHLTNASVTLIDRVAERRWRFTSVMADAVRDRKGYRLRADFDPPAGVARRGELVVAGEEIPDAIDTFSGRGYLRLQGADAAALAALLPRPTPPPPIAGQGDLAVWLDLASGRIISASAAIEAAALSFGQPALRLRDAASVLRWQRLERNGWTLAVTDLRLPRVDGPDWRQPMRLTLRRDPGAAGASGWRGSGAQVPLGELARLVVASGWLDPELGERLAALDPRGTAEAIRFGITDDARRWRVSASVHDAAAMPVGPFPGITGVTAQVTATEHGGTATLEADGGALRLPRLFREPLPFDRLAVEASWHIAADGAAQIAVSRLRATGDDGRLRAGGRIWIPPTGAAFLDLHAHLEGGNGTSTSRYLPAAIMPPELVRWLDGAIVDGRVMAADMTLFGPARAFPFRHGEGVFDIRAQVRDATFAYYPGWPALDSVDGRLHFHNAGLRIEATDARLFDIRLQEAVARIEDLTAPRLTAAGRFAGPGGDMLRALADSPLVDGEGEALLRRLRVTGEPELELALTVPFGPESLSVDGTVRLADTSLTLPQHGITVNRLAGTVHFNRDGLRWETLSGVAPGGRVTSQARTEGQGAAARIIVDTVFPATVAELLGERATALGDHLSGSTQWLMTVNAPGFQSDGETARVSLDSDLRGVSVDLPPPFGKAAKTARALQAEIALAGLENPRIDLHYGDLVSVGIAPEAGEAGAARIGIRLGGGVPQLPERPGIALSGRLARLDLTSVAAWRDAPGGSLPPVRSVDVELGAVCAAGWAIADTVRVTGRAAADGWRLALSGPGAAGELRLPADAPMPIEIALTHLRVQRAPQADSAPPPPSVRALPPLVATVERLEVDRSPWGRVTLSISADGAGHDATLTLDGPDLSLRAEAERSAESQRTRLQFRVDSEDLGAALTRRGYARVVDDGRGHAEGELSWQGSFLSPQLDTLDGSARLDLRDGSLPAVEPGAGRLVGLFNIARLPRRLLLDFSDLAADGLVFDRVRTAMRFEDGTARIDSFRLDGPAAQIRLGGTLGLVTTSYNLRVTVTPRIASTLPLLGGIAGALAGGPALAAGMLLTQPLFDAGLDGLGRYRYRVTGDWSNPRVERLPGAGTGADGNERNASGGGRTDDLR